MWGTSQFLRFRATGTIAAFAIWSIVSVADNLGTASALHPSAPGSHFQLIVISGLAVPFPPLGADILYFPVLTIGPRCS
jgi:hypothetical protein